MLSHVYFDEPEIPHAVEAFCCQSCRSGDTKHRNRECRKCHVAYPSCALIEKLDAKRGLCPYCAHAYELEIFTPPDHSAADCQLCTAH